MYSFEFQSVLNNHHTQNRTFSIVPTLITSVVIFTITHVCEHLHLHNVIWLNSECNLVLFFAFIIYINTTLYFNSTNTLLLEYSMFIKNYYNISTKLTWKILQYKFTVIALVIAINFYNVYA